MNPVLAFQILELALGLAKGAAGGGKLGTVIGQVQALEQIAAAVNQQHQQLVGKPLDLSLLTYEAPIEED